MYPTTLNTCEPGTALARALRMGDSALILSQRLCEQVAAAHSLEEDIAQANIALDLLGQARAWLTLAGEIEGAGRGEDELAYWRDAAAFENLLLAELPNEDFARCIMRQFLFASWQQLALRQLAADTCDGIADIAAKAQKENAYHLRHSAAWVERLGDGTDESHRRLAEALEYLWRWCGQFFDGVILPPAAEREWRTLLSEVLERARLAPPPAEQFIRDYRHSEYLSVLLAEMQCVHRAHPGMKW